MEEIKKLGICPICKQGQIVKGSIGYTCNHFKSMDDKCSFIIYENYFGKHISEEIATVLITVGETEVFNDLQKRDGSTFSASFKIEDGVVKPIFPNESLKNCCPACSGKVISLQSGYACENFHQKDEVGERICNLFIPKVIAGYAIDKEDAETLLEGQETEFLDGFKNKDGSAFSARLVLSEEVQVTFSSNLCQCPKCGGKMYVGKKAYNCSNYNNEEIKCDFVVWREISGREITPQEAINLCENSETEILKGFKTKEGKTIERKLIINDDFKVKIV